MPVHLLYRSDGVPDTYRDQAIRRAVLVPLYGPVPRRLVAKRVLGTHGLLSSWRAHLKALISGDEPTGVWIDRLLHCYPSMRNCRPTFVAARLDTPDHIRTCGARTFCPFCFGRRAGDLYDAVEWSLFLDPMLPRMSVAEEARRRMIRPPSRSRREGAPAASARPPHLFRSPHDLIERLTRLPTSACRLQVGNANADRLHVDPRASSLPFLLKGRCQGDPSTDAYGRPGEFLRCRKFGVLGAYENLSVRIVEPREGGQGYWSIRFRQLFVVSRNWDDRDPAIRAWLDDPTLGFVDKDRHKRRARWRRLRKPDRRAVALAVGRAAVYDPVLLTGAPHRVLEILDAREGKRLSATFGVLRNTTERRRLAG